MVRPLRIEYPGVFYRITSRGNERKAVFKSKQDRIKFLEYLGSATERYGACVHFYCLMDNHYICDMVDQSMKGEGKVARNVKIVLCHKYTELKLKTIGKTFGIGDSAVFKVSNRFGEKIEQDKQLNKNMKKLENTIKCQKSRPDPFVFP